MAEISILFPDLELPKRAVIGVTEDLEPAGTTEFGSTWNGRTVLLKPSYRTKYRVTLAADGEGVWTPSVDDLQTGTEIVLHSSVWWSTTLGVAQESKLLLRDPVPGSVAARDTDDETVHVPCNVYGRVAQIRARSGRTTILYRPVLRCIVGSVTMGGEATGRGQNWSIELMETAAP